MNKDPYKMTDEEVELAQTVEWGNWEETDHELFKELCQRMLALSVDEYREYLDQMEEAEEDCKQLCLV
jgi:hypothetical protein